MNAVSSFSPLSESFEDEERPGSTCSITSLASSFSLQRNFREKIIGTCMAVIKVIFQQREILVFNPMTSLHGKEAVLLPFGGNKYRQKEI